MHRDSRKHLFAYKQNKLQQYSQHFAQIHTLDLSCSQLDTIPSWVAQCTQLKHLNLRANNITTLPDFLFAFPHLSSIDLRWNDGWHQNLSKRFWEWCIKREKQRQDLSFIQASSESLLHVQTILGYVSLSET